MSYKWNIIQTFYSKIFKRVKFNLINFGHLGVSTSQQQPGHVQILFFKVKFSLLKFTIDQTFENLKVKTKY